jgi:hypothetical protein
MTDYKEGDLVKVYGENGQWYAEVVGENEDGQLEVFYINRGTVNRWVWQYDEDWDKVSKNSILEHIPLDKQKAVDCYKQLGFRPLTENTFVKLDDKIPDWVIIPTGDFNEEEEESDGSLDDFIVPDEEGEAFTPADPSVPFVQETHELVHKYNKWEPKTQHEEKLKGFVDKLSHKYKLKDDERQFVEGRSLDYDHPPLKKRKSGK